MRPRFEAGDVKPAAVAAILMLACGAAHADPLAVEIGRVGEVVSEPAGPPQAPRPGNLANQAQWRSIHFVHLGTTIEGAFCKEFAVEFRATNLAKGDTALV